jgi:hypothetical protein
MESPKLDLLGWGPVDAEILWIEGKLLKIKFKIKRGIYPFTWTKTRTKVFHYNEILNFNDIFIDRHLKIFNFDGNK